jgi:hypothetical protein
MPYRFKIWNQGHDGRTMGIRVEDINELASLATACTQPDSAGAWSNLQDYLDAVNVVVGAAPPPYTRIVDVVWLNPIGYGVPSYFPGRTLVVTYNGNQRATGGYATQCYCIVDPLGYQRLAPHDKNPLNVEYIAHMRNDLIAIV